jgi:hypothetical protein
MTFSETIDDRTGARHELGHSRATSSSVAILKQFAC